MNEQDTILDEITKNNSFGVVMSREWTQHNYQKSWLIGNLKEGKNEAAPDEPGKMGYIQPWVKEVQVCANGTIEGNGIWKSEGVARRFKTAQYICVGIFMNHFCTKYQVHNFNGSLVITIRPKATVNFSLL